MLESRRRLWRTKHRRHRIRQHAYTESDLGLPLRDTEDRRNRHSGIPVIREEAASRGLRQPEFLDRNGSFLVRFFNENATLDDLTTADRAGAFTRQSVSQSVRSTDVDHHGNVGNDPGAMRGMILRYCREPRSAKDIAEHFGYNMTYMRKTFIRPMVAQGALSMTMPSKPRSKYQRYLAASNAASDAR